MEVINGCLVGHAKSDYRFDAYMHQCNCFCRMGRGIAPQLASAFPEVREVDNYTIPGDIEKMGHFSVTRKTSPIIYNLYGQYHWKDHQPEPGRNTDYGKLAYSIISASKDMESKGVRSVGIPLIGCGLAGGDWEIVKCIIEGAFMDTDIKVTLFIKE